MSEAITIPKPEVALRVGTEPPADAKPYHEALRVSGGDTIVHPDGYIVGPDVDLGRLVDAVKAQRENPVLYGHAMGALPKASD